LRSIDHSLSASAARKALVADEGLALLLAQDADSQVFCYSNADIRKRRRCRNETSFQFAELEKIAVVLKAPSVSTAEVERRQIGEFSGCAGRIWVINRLAAYPGFGTA
jgi:hypothetical protein